MSSIAHQDRLREWLGLERNIVVMLATLLVLGMGEELWVRFIPKYLELLGAGVGIIALYGALKDLLDAIYPYPGGWLADRLGRRAALVLFTLLAIIGYGIYLAGSSWQGILIGTFFVMAWSSLTLPAIFAIIGDHLPQGRRAIGFGVQSILKRAPIVLAPPLGGWLIASMGLAPGIKLALWITLLLGGVALIILLRYYVERPISREDKAGLSEMWRRMDSRLKRLLIADCLARWAEGTPKVFIILFLLNTARVNPFQFGWLTGAQMATSMLVYIPIAKRSDQMNRTPFVLLTFLFFALFPLALVSAPNLRWITLAFVIGGLREIGEPARKAMIVDLAAQTARGRAVGTYYLIRGLAVFPASFVGGWLWTIGPQWPFYIAFMIGVAGLFTYALWGPDEEPLAPPQNTL